MARKKRTKPMEAGDRRRQLLAVACDIIAEEGLGGLTMASLAARADVSKPVAYGLFAQRQDVAMALLVEHYEAIRAFTLEHLGTPATLEAYVRKVAQAAFEFRRIDNIPIDNLIHGFSPGDAVNSFYLRQEVEIEDLWKRLLIQLGVVPSRAALGAKAMRAIATSMATKGLSASQQKLGEEVLADLQLGVFAALKARQPTPDEMSKWIQKRKAALRKLP